eukprot:6376084-Alexandrium_andersonii.AAC.1
MGCRRPPFQATGSAAYKAILAASGWRRDAISAGAARRASGGIPSSPVALPGERRRIEAASWAMVGIATRHWP